MQNEIIRAIAYIKTVKESRKLTPPHALKREILNVIAKEANDSIDILLSEGRIKEVRTLNDVAYIVRND